MGKLNLDEQEIIRLYTKERLTQTEIGGKFGCTRKPIFNILKKHGIICNQISLTPKERLQKLIKVNSKTECWEFQGSLFKGYGRIQVDGKRYRAHRLAYEIYVGKIEEGLLICHVCDVCHCVNPKHLFLGTHQDNQADKVAKGRQAKGMKIHCAKVDNEVESQIIQLYHHSFPASKIAAKLNIHRCTILHYLHKNNLRRNIADETKNKMIELRSQGLSFNKIAKQLGIGKTSVRRHLERMNQSPDTL